ncbi:MAG: baseplate J/gp47 family protein [Planctomycetota bacterium]
MAESKNRLLDLLDSSTLNGIDYVEVTEGPPIRLVVHFLNKVAVLEPGQELVVSITGGDRIPTVAVGAILAGDWSTDGQMRPVLTLRVRGRGDFSNYTLRIEGGTKLDAYFRQVSFSFFAFCPSRVDCLSKPESCPGPNDKLPPIDYLAKDFDSFRQALSDFSAQRFPNWRERAEADLGVMLMEVLCAIGDDLSYLQDRVHAQAVLETATERRSIVRLARLVDYEPRPITSAQTMIQCQVASTTTILPAGIQITARSPDGTFVPFEIGKGLRDATQYRANSKWNKIEPYWWDDGDRCLGIGSTELYVKGHGLNLFSGQLLLVDTGGLTTADSPIREVVTLVDTEELTDLIYGEPVTRMTWRPEDALKQHHDQTRTVVMGNLLPATQGQLYVEQFAIQDPDPSNSRATLAVFRLGQNGTVQHLYTLLHHPLACLKKSDRKEIEPELIVTSTSKSAVSSNWSWVRSLLEAGPFEKKITIDPAAWRPVMATSQGVVHDYDGSEGATLRFGDGTFGELPNDGDVFEVQYRTSLGAAGNVAPDTITDVDPTWMGSLTSVNNPFGAESGSDAETDEQVRRRAPFAFRKAFRAVREEDYNEAASTLEWVQRAGTVFRWTGSWPTILTTADPKNTGTVSKDQHIELTQLLNRRRLAGYECYAPNPNYVSFDVEIEVCAKPEAFRGDVLAAVQRALDPIRYPDGTVGFFHFDNFTLGTPFDRSRLEAAVQNVHGVAGVLSIRYRRRGQHATYVAMPSRVNFTPGEIFRLDNNASRPERGSYRIQIMGGK